MTPEDQIKAIRYYTHDQVAVAVFTYGTAILCEDLADASQIMRAYDVPRDGEGGPVGDMQPLDMDDGNTMTMFRAPLEWRVDVPRGQAVRIASVDDLVELSKTAAPSATEVFAGHQEDLVLSVRSLHACLAARRARTQDAQHPSVVASWTPKASV